MSPSNVVFLSDDSGTLARGSVEQHSQGMSLPFTQDVTISMNLEKNSEKNLFFFFNTMGEL